MRTRRQFRPACMPESLESRVVPSHATAHVAAVTTGATAAARQRAALAAAGTQINAAYAEYAATVRQIAADAFPVSSQTTPTLGATVTTQIGQATDALASQVGSALGTVPGASRYAAVVAAGINGAGEGSLDSQLNGLFDSVASILVGSRPGSIGSEPASYIILYGQDRTVFFASVEDALASSYQATSVQGYLAAVAGSAQSSTAAANLSAIGSLVNPAYATFADGVRQTVGLIQPDFTDPAAPTTGTTIAPLGTTLNNAVATLSQSLAAGLAGTPAGPAAGLLRGQLVGPQAGSLAGRLANLTGILNPTASSTNYLISINTNTTPVLAAYDLAIAASYQAISIEGYIIGTSRALTAGA